MSKQLKTLAAFFAVLVTLVSAVNVISSAFSSDTTYYTFSGNAYEIVDTGYTYSSANSAASRKGGHIIYINSVAEQNFIKGIVSSGKYWLGATYSSSAGWTWGGGSSVLYSNWYGDTPASSTEKYSYFDASTGYWFNSERSNSYYLIVEYEGGASKVNSANETNNENAVTTTTTTTQTTTSESTTAAETVSGSDVTQDPNTPSATRASVSIVYVRETAASGFTLPIATVPASTDENETESPLKNLDIGSTVYIYEDSFYYQIANGSEIVIAYYVGSDTDITIPETIDSMPVKYISQRAFQNTKLTSATIYSGVEIIEKSAFCNVSSDFVIYGESSSAAQQYAEENGFKFTEVSFMGSGNEGSNESTVTGTTSESHSNTRLTIIVAVLIAVVIAAAVVAFLLVRKEKIISAVEEKNNPAKEEPEYKIEYDDGSDDEDDNSSDEQ